MRRFVILLNFLLITLIIFNFLNKTDTLIENLEGCPDNKKNMVYKQKAKTEQLLNELNELRTEIMALKTSTNTNKILTEVKKKKTKSAVAGINDEKERKMKELDSIE